MQRILIADDHDLVRDTIAAFISQQPDLRATTASTLPEALRLLGRPADFDLTILDYKMPGMDGLDGLRAAMAKHPRMAFALMSGEAPDEVAKQAMDMGAVGFFPKSLSANSLVSAVRLVLSGDCYFPFRAEKRSPSASIQRSDYRGLSARETETLRKLCLGKSNKEIALDLDIKEVTVKLHVKNILAKMQVRNRTQAALVARDEGFV
ncbi:DNA-binding response regulator, LuxR family [Candidatus Rhodobacter oscarellae]|uniref:DNA-binding response regulator, LuxR family n=1 Tax=Candidatus Rhodobacter oscarellae TaxID=1675527 RepID=A0A0J9EA17_9RHOB|nr:response regulator transcription factor [Candidatus Rhodobacter lobularis]KMW59617.1 DNA-binding response regulator, LuxR family [Candidatus Rhodobacter lobularis]